MIARGGDAAVAWAGHGHTRVLDDASPPCSLLGTLCRIPSSSINTMLYIINLHPQECVDATSMLSVACLNRPFFPMFRRGFPSTHCISAFQHFITIQSCFGRCSTKSVQDRAACDTPLPLHASPSLIRQLAQAKSQPAHPRKRTTWSISQLRTWRLELPMFSRARQAGDRTAMRSQTLMCRI